MPSAEDTIFGEWFANRSASRVINRRQHIDKISRMKDRSASRVMNNRDLSKGRIIVFFDKIKGGGA